MLCYIYLHVLVVIVSISLDVGFDANPVFLCIILGKTRDFNLNHKVLAFTSGP